MRVFGAERRQPVSNSVMRALYTITVVLCTSIAAFGQSDLVTIHARLRKYHDLHDEYLRVAAIGNEETVPLLLNRLKKDYGATEPVIPPGKAFGGDCAQFHLVDALRAITNTDQGLFYPRWKSWWVDHRSSTQKEWILEGFRSLNLHPHDPIDAEFGKELIEVFGYGETFQVVNAKRLLANVHPVTLLNWISESSISERRSLRLGVAKLLSQEKETFGTGILQTLSEDPDAEVRNTAIAALSDLEKK